MSYQAVQWALDLAPMLRTPAGKPDTTARAVLVARAERADESGRNTHAGIADVMWRTGYDERTVQRAEDRLEAAGLMVRDGVTHLGTARWHLDMSLRRDESERAEIEAAIEGRKAANADRERQRREARRAVRAGTVDNPRVDPASTRGESPSTRVDSASERVDAAPPKPPRNLPGTSPESPSGGSTAPRPPRPPVPSGQGNEQPIPTYVQQGPLHRPPYVSYDRAHARHPRRSREHLSVIEGGAA